MTKNNVSNDRYYYFYYYIDYNDFNMDIYDHRRLYSAVRIFPFYSLLLGHVYFTRLCHFRILWVFEKFDIEIDRPTRFIIVQRVTYM